MAAQVTAEGIPIGPEPINVKCPKCGNTVTTEVKKKIGPWAWVSFGVLCVCGCWLGCCLIPFCINALNYRVHRCPVCKAFIGRYNG